MCVTHYKAGAKGEAGSAKEEAGLVGVGPSVSCPPAPQFQSSTQGLGTSSL